MSKNIKVYCIRRPAEGCKLITYNKDGLCSSCQNYLSALALDIELIRKYNIKPDFIETQIEPVNNFY